MDIVREMYDANTDPNYRVYVNQGGTSSAKTYTILQVLLMLAVKEAKNVITVVGQDLPNIKVGAWRDIKTIISDDGALMATTFANESNHTISFRNGSLIEFKSYENEQDAKSGKRDYLFVNEANGINYDVYWQLAIRTKKKIWIDYNPSERFWVHDKIIGGQGVKLIISDYRQNLFLPSDMAERIASIEDKELRKVYTYGLTGKLEGLIIRDWSICDAMPPTSECKVRGFGLDFGFSQDPTALVDCALAHGELWFDSVIYETGLTNPQIAQRIKAHHLSALFPVVADSAEPKSIAEIRSERINVVPASKGNDSIRIGIDIMRRYKWNITRHSAGLIEEVGRYKWKTSRSGDPTNDPIDSWNHAIDAIRYWCMRNLVMRPQSVSRAHNIKVG